MILSKKYKPLWTEKYRYAILSGGRGSAKSFSVQTYLRDLTYWPKQKIALTRYTMASAEKSIIPEFTEKIELEGLGPDFQLTGKTYRNLTTDAELYFMGLKTSSGVQTASLKSIHGLSTWCMEEAEELIDDGTDESECTFDKIDNSIRVKGLDLRTILMWNPSTEDSFVYKRFFKDRGVDITHNGVVDDTLYIFTTYEDNARNLHPSFLKKAEQTRRANPARFDHIYGGIPIKENALALWKQSTMISPYRVAERPAELKRVVVAVDPSVTSSGNQDECGIMVCAEDFKGHYYVFEDLSERVSPIDWAKISVGAYVDNQADCLVAEVNQGGDLVELNVNTVDSTIPVKKVTATRGKILRAEPISSLYQQGRVHHVGRFPELELEMTSYTGDKKDKSPNRLDALVWGLTELHFGDAGGFSMSWG